MQTGLRKPTRVGRSPLPLVRSAVSTALLLLLIAGSIPVWGVLDRAAMVIVQAQLLPALLRLRERLAVGAGAALFVFPLILTLTAVFGRGYCSSLCPLGTLQDGALRLSRRFLKVRLRFHKPHGALRAATLAIVVASWIAGSAIPLSLLEPYSMVSRVLSAANGSGASANRPLAQEAGSPDGALESTAMRFVPAALSAALLLLVLAAAAGRGRLFCNTLCPAGALLSLPGRFSILRIRLSEDRCNGCGLCENVCPARCIDVSAKRIYAGSCTLCFSCLNACRRGALRFARRGDAT